MSTRLKSSRPEISLTKFSAEGAVMKVHVLLPETHKYEWIGRASCRERV